MAKLNVIELTKDNCDKYIDQIIEIENKVLSFMEKQGKIGQLFITEKEDILDYINSNQNTVMCAVEDKDNVKSTTFITQGQKPFTYNDITKYFKVGEIYNKYIKSIYGKKQYKQKMIEIYSKKIEAYQYARDKVLIENPEYKSIDEFINHELESENQFDEKSILRESINTYMSEYMQKSEYSKMYEHFYWTTLYDIAREFEKKINIDNMKNDTIKEYERFLNREKLIIHDNKLNDKTKYFNANTNNSIEIDTYITDPDSRHMGIARILVYEGIKTHINNTINDIDGNKLYLCSTLHKDNLSSKYVSEFFGLTDNIFVKRRTNRDREIHICAIEKLKIDSYLEHIENKLIVLYKYNPKNKIISSEEEQLILTEQLEYEKSQYRRLNKIRNNNKNYKGDLKDIQSKLNKMGDLKVKLNKLKTLQKDRTDEGGR